MNKKKGWAGLGWAGLASLHWLSRIITATVVLISSTTSDQRSTNLSFSHTAISQLETFQIVDFYIIILTGFRFIYVFSKSESRVEIHVHYITPS